MTGKEIQKIVGKDRLLAGHRFVAENISYVVAHEMDVMSISRRMLYEYEVKISRSDFLADKKKRKFKNFGIADNAFYTSLHMPNYFSYVCPNEMIEKSEIPDYAGLFYIVHDELYEIKAPIKLHNIKRDLDFIQKKLLTVYTERNFLGKCLMTYKNDQAKNAFNNQTHNQ